MATDRVNRVHTPAFLQTFSLGFTNREMIADKVAPRVPVMKQSDKYRVWGKRGFIAHESRWAPGTIPNSIEQRWSEGTFYADLRKLRTPVTDDERRNQDDGDIDLDTSGTELVTNAMIISREKRVADMFTLASNYAAGQKITKSGGSEWDVAGVMATAQPLIDIMALVALVSKNALVPISQLSVVIPEIVFTTALWNNAAILDRIKYSNTGIVTSDLLRAALGVKEVIFSASMSVSGPEVADSDVVTGFTPTFLWGDTVWVGLINEGRNQNAPSFARSFNWRAATANQDRQIRKYRMSDEGQEGDWIECKEAIGEKIVYADAGGIIINTLSTI